MLGLIKWTFRELVRIMAWTAAVLAVVNTVLLVRHAETNAISSVQEELLRAVMVGWLWYFWDRNREKHDTPG